jgi:hypothetical protein
VRGREPVGGDSARSWFFDCSNSSTTGVNNE